VANATHHTLGIFEAGISKPNEMARLQEIIRPTRYLRTSARHTMRGFQNVNKKYRRTEPLRFCDLLFIAAISGFGAAELKNRFSQNY